MDRAEGAGSPFRDPEDPKFEPPKPVPPPLPGTPSAPGARRGRRQRFSLDIGRVLKLSFSTYFKALPWFLLLGVLIHLPVLVAGFVFYSEPREYQTERLFEMGASYVSFLLLQSILTATMVWWVVEHLRGGTVSVDRCLKAGFRRLLPVIALSFLLGIVYLLGLLFLIVPGLIAMVTYYVALPVTVIEGGGPVRAMSRSATLSGGSRWQIFGLLVILFMLSAVFAAITTVPVSLLARGPLPQWAVFCLNQVISLVPTTFGAVVPAVVYQEFRVGREGEHIQALAEVFA